VSHVVSIVLNVDAARAEEFEAGFREHELPIWQDLRARGLIVRAALVPLAISTLPREGIMQYLVSVWLRDSAAHHAHDEDPRFKRWNELADAFQPEEPFVFGGDAIIEVE
jgi:hypothetical protein